MNQMESRASARLLFRRLRVAARDIPELHVTWDSAHLLPGLDFLQRQKNHSVPRIALTGDLCLMLCLAFTCFIVTLIASCKECVMARETEAPRWERGLPSEHAGFEPDSSNPWPIPLPTPQSSLLSSSPGRLFSLNQGACGCHCPLLCSSLRLCGEEDVAAS